ncbi:MAG: hydrogenase expression/formation protein, partial [Methylococcaceae bacterium]|nr:hydrogenase expression/formation protein [Methylococcaceae bacterium]
MSTFKNIPISVELPSPVDDTAIVHAVLHEIQLLVEEFVRSGQSGAIDLRQVPPMGPEGYQFLKDSLSAGEVTASIKGVGRTEVQETAYSGVWWVTHRNQKDEILT